jgi:hemerythrin superfamily protein
LAGGKSCCSSCNGAAGGTRAHRLIRPQPWERELPSADTHTRSFYDTPFLRRSMLLSAAAAVLPLQQAVAQASRSGADWFEMVRVQHRLVSSTMQELLNSENRTYLRRQALQHTLSYQLTAHSVAEENVLYPLMAGRGLLAESDKLYLDQAHAKVMNTQLEMLLLHKKEDTAWLDAARQLRAAVLSHATKDEEATLYPRLRAMLSASENAEARLLFAREFATVRPRRVSGVA